MTPVEAIAPGNASSAAIAAGEGATTCDPPADALARPFDEPWQAQAFALTLRLHERGLFAWTEWAAYLSRAIADAQAKGDPDLGDTYYVHWVAALERLLIDKGVAAPLALAGLRHSWRMAAEATPHGQPVRLNAAVRRLGASDGA